MPRLMVPHEVDDVAHWLAPPKRAEVFDGVARDIRTFTHPENPAMVGLTMEVDDVAAFRAVVRSDAGAEAMRYDGVRPETVVVLVES